MESNRVINFLTLSILLFVPIEYASDGVSNYLTPILSVIVYLDGSYTIDFFEFLPFTLILISLIFGLFIKVEKSFTLQYFSRVLLVLLISYILTWIYILSSVEADSIIHDFFSWENLINNEGNISFLSFNIIAIVFILNILYAYFKRN